jgi:hypothetical protein
LSKKGEPEMIFNFDTLPKFEIRELRPLDETASTNLQSVEDPTSYKILPSRDDPVSYKQKFRPQL